MAEPEEIAGEEPVAAEPAAASPKQPERVAEDEKTNA